MYEKLTKRLQEAQTPAAKLEVAFKWARAQVVNTTQVLGKMQFVFPKTEIVYLESSCDDLAQWRVAEITARVNGEWETMRVVLMTPYSGTRHSDSILLTWSEAANFLEFVHGNLPAREGVR